MGDCTYCQKPAGLLNKLHQECQEGYVSAVFAIREMCKEAALRPASLDELPARIRNTASAGHIRMSDSQLNGLLAKFWCDAVDGIIEDRGILNGESIRTKLGSVDISSQPYENGSEL